MPSGTLHAAQLPASLRAIDSVADVFHSSSAREVGRRVYGHRDGLTVKERYLLAEKREALLGSTREASIQQREKQRSLRGKLVQFDKHARRMVLHASRPCDRKEDGEGTHTIVANIVSTGPLRSDSLKLRGADSRRDIKAHVHGIRDTIERMNHTFIMAHVRSDLFAAVRGLGGCSGKGREEGVGLSSSTRSNGEESVILRRPPHDLQALSPRKRYLRRRAAVCLQRHARGRPVRRLFGELTRAVLQFRGAREPPRYSSGSMGRRAMLIARLKVVSAAYERILDILPSLPRLSGEITPHLTEPAAASQDTSCEPPQPSKEEAPSASIRSARAPHQNVQHVASKTAIEVVGRGGDGHEDLALSGAAAAEREFRILLWALRDVAARVIQQEVRGYARRQIGRRRLLERSRGEVGNVGEDMMPIVLADVTNTQEASRGSSCGSVAGGPGVGAGSGSASGQRLRPVHVRAASFGVKGGTDEVATPNTLTLPVGEEQSFLFRPEAVRSPDVSTASTRYQERDTDGDERGDVPGHFGDLFSKGAGTTTRSEGPQGTRSSIFGGGAGSGGSQERFCAGKAHCNSARARDVGLPLLPSEESKRRLNEAHLRRNNSRRGQVQKALVGLECQGRSVLSEIIRMQRLFRAKRARRIFGESQARQEAQHAAWKEKQTRERRENAARWKHSMSRLKAVRPSARSPDSKTAGIADVVGETLHRSHELGVEGKPSKPGVPDELAEKVRQGEPYASARWGLAVMYDLESWRGGLRQRHYFGRLLSFLGHRRRCKAALRAAVEVRMVKRLQAWATVLSEAKRSLTNSIKAHAPPEVVGAHLRFLSRSGTWELLLTDLDGLLEAAFSHREHAVELLREQCSDVLPVGQPTRRHGAARSSALPRRRAASTASISSRKKGRLTQLASASRPLSRELFAGGCQLSGGLFAAEGDATRRKMTRSELPAGARLREIVDEEVLTRLHPWVVALLAKSGLQFVPSVPHKRRIRHRTIDASQEEIRAEAQLTTRYWKFLKSVSSAILYVRAAEVEAAALAAEAGEWALLLGFARHLTSGGFLYPPCTLPHPPRCGGKDGGFNVMGEAVGGSNPFPAPTQRNRNPAEPVQRGSRSFGGVREEDATRPWLGGTHKCDEAEEIITCKPQEQAGATTVARWFSRNKDLCEECWAMRVGASAVGGSKCQRCGKMHRRGFAKGKSERGTGSSSTRGDDGTVDPILWQQFNQVQESLGLFVVHAAYACVLHPGCKGDDVTYERGPGWWNGGNPEEAWWRAVCGGKRAAAAMRSRGCDTIGKLYTCVLTSTATSPLILQAASSEETVLMGRGVGDIGSAKLLNGRNAVEGSCVGCGPTRKRTQGPGGGSQRGKLLRMVQDEGLAAKLSSLLLRLMSAFEHLRKENRWPTVSIAAVEHAVRELCLPGVVGTTWTTST